MPDKPSITNTPNPNPKVGDYLKARGPSAKPPSSDRSSGSGLPQSRLSDGGRKR